MTACDSSARTYSESSVNKQRQKRAGLGAAVEVAGLEARQKNKVRHKTDKEQARQNSRQRSQKLAELFTMRDQPRTGEEWRVRPGYLLQRESG